MTAPPDEIVAKVRELTPFATTARYPGDDEPVSEPEARRAIEVAAGVRDTVRTALGSGNVIL